MVKKISISSLFLLLSVFMCYFFLKNETLLNIIYKKNLPLNTLYSHRGLNSTGDKIGSLEGENSVPSFILAGQHKYKYLETDVYESKDGKFYCIHDDETIAYSNDNITITKSLSQAIEKIRLNKTIKNANIDQEFQHKAYNIPSLEIYLKICKKYNMIPLIEIKKLQNYTKSVENVIDIASKYTDKFIIFSFDLPYVLKAKQYKRNIPVLYLTPEDNQVTNEVVDFYTSRGIGLAVPLGRINKDVCEYSFNKGYPMIIWSIDNKTEYISKYKNWKVWMFGTNSIVL